jgi:hypothetical protein
MVGPQHNANRPVLVLGRMISLGRSGGYRRPQDHPAQDPGPGFDGANEDLDDGMRKIWRDLEEDLRDS